MILLKEPSIEKALLTLHVTTETHFLPQKNLKKCHARSCHNVCDVLTFSLDSILFCYEKDFILSLSDDNRADIIDAFHAASRYLDDILNIDNFDFDNMVKSSNLIKLITLIPKPRF